MRQVQTDLWETEVESPFPGLTTHAYLLIRDEGNVLFYNTGHLHEIDRVSLADSIRMLQTLEPDVVFSSAFSAPSGFQEMRPGEWAAHLDWALEQLLGK
ncbi:hypothetical protein [Nitrincola alkalilacustris]|uniref:hypothetical protein n=1 Tax=Nitrincola alkalilacustris TaxID=1571224 RepID=UPI00124EDFB4|nr:hypothetical protein [Nitrincola alkalilacustris]